VDRKSVDTLLTNGVTLTFTKDAVVASLQAGDSRGAVGLEEFMNVVAVLKEEFGAGDTSICIYGRENRIDIQTIVRYFD